MRMLRNKRLREQGQSNQIRESLKSAFKSAQKVISLEKGLSMDHFVKIGNGVLNPKNRIGDALLNRLKQTAQQEGRTDIAFDITKAHAIKMREESKNQARQNTVLRSKQAHVDLRPNMDADKNYFLNEFMKLLAFAENYMKQKQYVALYNAAMALAFICIQVRHYALANKVYSLFA